MEPDELLDLFDRLAAQVADALGSLGDWGLSGLKDTQYRHDVVADDIVGAGLSAAGLAVLSEETGLTGGPGGEAPITVVVDPVDGSTNASRGLPWYAISLCAVDAEGPLAALVLNLATGTRYRAIRGSGARRDRSPIRVEPGRIDGGAGGGAGRELGCGFTEAEPLTSSGCQALSEAIVAFSGLPPGPGGWNQHRVFGAAALDLCAVAEGSLDGYVDVDRAHGVWDYLGAWLVCREAGAMLADLAGEELVVLDPEARRGPVAAATPELLTELGDMVAGWS